MSALSQHLNPVTTLLYQVAPAPEFPISGMTSASFQARNLGVMLNSSLPLTHPLKHGVQLVLLPVLLVNDFLSMPLALPCSRSAPKQNPRRLGLRLSNLPPPFFQVQPSDLLCVCLPPPTPAPAGAQSPMASPLLGEGANPLRDSLGPWEAARAHLFSFLLPHAPFAGLLWS